uniref:Ig-like domain-containing protein n=1 Tax=Prolemur simus TaxID=1328070 RepID=A0A8C8YWD5_PROSS
GKMEGFPGFSPAGFLLPFLLLQGSAPGSAVSGFSVKGPAEPIVALLGEDATLPCQLSPEQSAAHMDIRWYRAQLSPAVLVFQNRQDPGGEQMLEYRGRAQLIQVRASDDGQYGCRFQDGDLFREAVVQLHVVGLDSAPHVHMTGPEEGGIRVLCSSGGWFPKPKVQWRDTAGVKLPSLPESQTQDGDGLFHVEASLVVKDSSMGNVTCSIQNPLSGQEKVSAVFFPGQWGTQAKGGAARAGMGKEGCWESWTEGRASPRISKEMTTLSHLIRKTSHQGNIIGRWTSGTLMSGL